MQRSIVAPHPLYQPSGSRWIGVVLVVLMHLALAYALVSALARRAVTVAPVIVETEIVAESPPQSVSPVATPAVPPIASAPPPKIAAPLRPPAPHRAEMKLEPSPPPPSPEPAPTVTTAPPITPPAPAAPVQVMPHLDRAKSHEPEYPPQSRQLGEQGSVVLQVLVGADGTVLDTKLVQSSGYVRLDQAALREITSSYRFVPGTIDGKPQPMWYTIKYNWKLR